MKIRMLQDLDYYSGGEIDLVLYEGHIYTVVDESATHYVVFEGEKHRFVHKNVAELINVSPIVPGVSPDQPVVYNEKGGGQSKSPYRMDLVDPKSILEIASVLKEGAEKYGDDNWKLISAQDHLNHLLVHVYAHLAGDESDKHLAHAACRAIFALGVELEGE